MDSDSLGSPVAGRIARRITRARGRFQFKQRFITESRPAPWYEPAPRSCQARFDDECGSGHNTFAITGDVQDCQGANWPTVACMMTSRAPFQSSHR